MSQVTFHGAMKPNRRMFRQQPYRPPAMPCRPVFLVLLLAALIFGGCAGLVG